MKIFFCYLIVMISTSNFLRAEEILICKGKFPEKTSAILPKIATDLTPELEVVGPNGEWPLKGIFWELKNFDLVFALHGDKEGNVLDVLYWTKEEFNQGKETRYDLGKTASSIALDLDARTFKIWKDGKQIASNITEKQTTQHNIDSSIQSRSYSCINIKSNSFNCHLRLRLWRRICQRGDR